MSLSLSRKRRVKCFGSYHDDLCILPVSLICWLKQESWLGRKCYLSWVNNILKCCQNRWAVCISVGSWAIKLLHEIHVSVSWLACSSYSFSHVFTVWMKENWHTSWLRDKMHPRHSALNTISPQFLYGFGRNSTQNANHCLIPVTLK